VTPLAEIPLNTGVESFASIDFRLNKFNLRTALAITARGASAADGGEGPV
jgi:hypothetical protein